MSLLQLKDVTGAGLHLEWSDLYTPNAPAAVPNLDPGNYTAAFMGLSSFRTYNSRGAIIMFAMDATPGTPRFMHWYLAYSTPATGATGAFTAVAEVLKVVDNEAFLQEVQAGLTHFRRVDVSNANACVMVPINFPAWANDVTVTIMTRREAGWAGAVNDVSTVAVALSDEPLDLNKVQALYSAQKGTTAGGMGVTGTVVDANHNALDEALNSSAKGVSVALPITGTVIDANHNALDVTLAAAGAVNATIVAPLGQMLPATAVATVENLPFSGGTPRAPTNIADNLVHEITDGAGAGMQVGRHYVVTQIGGADIQVYVAAAAPAIATLRRSPYHLFNGIPWSFCPSAAGQHLYAGKSVDGTANADLYVDSSDLGTGY